MAERTENYDLIKPEYEDTADIQDLNDNADSLDTILAGKKDKQTAKTDPTAEGTAVAFIDSLTQDADGVVTATKKTVKAMVGATSSAAGAAGLVPAPAAADKDKFLKGDGTYGTPANTTYNEATSSAYGLVKVGYTTSGKNYAVQLSSGKMYVEVPWTDTNTTYSQASSSALGLIKIGYSANNKNYPVQLDGSGKAYVNVPWTDNNTTYNEASSSNYGLIKIGYSANGKNYPVQLSGGKAYVYVPWTDTNTTYSNFTTSAAGIVPASGNANNVLAGNGWVTLQNLVNTLQTAAYARINNWYGKPHIRYGQISNVESNKAGFVDFALQCGEAFPNNCLYVGITLDSSFQASARVSVTSFAKNGFNYNVYANNGQNLTFHFIAFGY